MERNLPNVTVLLATFNGEKFLDAQLTSLQMQKGVSVRVIANDDGSSDSTVEILEAWKKSGLIREIYRSNRIGPSRVFHSLITKTDGASFVALADQDDVWHRSKLEILCRIIDKSRPSLAFSERELIDANGKCIGKSRLVRQGVSFGNALIENVVPGNTVLLNSQAVSLIKKFPLRDLDHFDAWIYLLITAFGVCKYTTLHLVSYRLHANNTVGLRKFRPGKFCLALDSWENRAKLLYDHGNSEFDKAAELYITAFLRLYSNKRSICSFLSILNFKFQRQKRLDSIAIKWIFLFRLAVGNQLWNRLSRYLP